MFPTTGNPWPFYITMVALIAVSMMIIYRLQDSRLGRAWMAIREDELAASANGVNTVVTKLLAFALGASTAGLAGVFASSKLTLVSPNLFRFDVSFTVLAMVVLGGMGNIWGVAVGAFIIFMIQSVLLKQLNLFFDNVQVPILSDIDFLQYQFLLYGIALVAMMLLRPEGLFPSRRRKRGAAHGRGRGLRRVGRPARGGTRMSAEPAMPLDDAPDATPPEAAPPRPTPAPTLAPGPDAEILLHADRVTRRFGGLVAVRDVDLVIPKGGIISIIGPNGAGKTTFFNVIAGIIDPTQGSVTFRDRVADHAAAPRAGSSRSCGCCRRSSPLLIGFALGALAERDRHRHHRPGRDRAPGVRPGDRGRASAVVPEPPASLRRGPQRPPQRRGRVGDRPHVPEHPPVPEHDACSRTCWSGCTSSSRPTSPIT